MVTGESRTVPAGTNLGLIPISGADDRVFIPTRLLILCLAVKTSLHPDLVAFRPAALRNLWESPFESHS
jgi:hypothetical protein